MCIAITVIYLQTKFGSNIFKHSGNYIEKILYNNKNNNNWLILIMKHMCCHI